MTLQLKHTQLEKDMRRSVQKEKSRLKAASPEDLQIAKEELERVTAELDLKKQALKTEVEAARAELEAELQAKRLKTENELMELRNALELRQTEFDKKAEAELEELKTQIREKMKIEMFAQLDEE